MTGSGLNPDLPNSNRRSGIRRSGIRRSEIRRSGILCHITSLPSAFGVGDLGPEAFRFVDFLSRAGQSVWQTLPVCPPAHNHSPYSCYSALAGNPLLISPEVLANDGLLSESDIEEHRAGAEASADFDAAETARDRLLKRAFENFKRDDFDELNHEFEQYISDQSGWLNDFALFESAMEHFDELDWTEWPDELSSRSAEGIASYQSELSVAIERSKFIQFLFDRQWNDLRQYAAKNGVQLCGDMPIFVAHESADVWSHPGEFCLDDDGKPALVAGVPPDYFSETGQLWGNPQYRWDVMESNDFAWWTNRFARSLQQFDSLRVDHFRGFEAYWEIPGDAKTAVSGKWVQGPGTKPFLAAEKKLGKLPLIAEDLGLITEEVHELRDDLGYPGMRVLQFGLDGDETEYHHPANYPVDCVAYTGTHDNDTLMGWHASRAKNASFKNNAKELIGLDFDADYRTDDTIHWKWIECVLQSPAKLVLFPIQDLLGLGNDARMNVPGKAKGNWGWRLRPDQLTDAIASQMKAATLQSSRVTDF